MVRMLKVIVVESYALVRGDCLTYVMYKSNKVYLTSGCYTPDHLVASFIDFVEHHNKCTFFDAGDVGLVTLFSCFPAGRMMWAPDGFKTTLLVNAFISSKVVLTVKSLKTKYLDVLFSSIGS